ncbi:hypothetical protein HAX54_014058 [Datura stramonium]|uniref:DM2 domain-containing protein n=1 Tax=Datura stramonium TaxID=4076 RepID=A0ABS8TQ33_DATST|nr:hypothetical protein [Datura stramonium]
MVSDSVLVDRLREILRVSDLETATAGTVRRRLEEELRVDMIGKPLSVLLVATSMSLRTQLSGSALYIQDLFFDSCSPSSQILCEEKATEARQRKDALVKFFGNGENALPRADVIKRIWQYIKENDLQDPSDKKINHL